MVQEKLKFTDEQIALANSVNLINYAQSRGYPIKQITPHSYKIPRYGGLYIHSGGHKWNHFSQDTGGGAIQFVMHMENITWVEAIKELLGLPTEYRSFEPLQPKQKEKGIFKLPEKNDTYKHIFAYLIGTRKLDKQIIYDFVKQNKIYENKYYNNCVFVGYDRNQEARYAAVRGTTSSLQYRKDVANSDKSYPFCREGKGDKLCVYESPIDLISYLTLLKLHGVKDFDAHCISLGGVCDNALERYLNENPDIKEVTLCLDNDKAGRFACEQIRQKYADRYRIRCHLPKGKDFNADLIALTKEMGRPTITGQLMPMGTLDESDLLLSQ